MYCLIVFLPLLGSLFSGFAGFYLGARGAAFLTTLSVSLSLFFSLIAFTEVALLGQTCSIRLAPWIDCDLLDAYWGFIFDPLSVVMCVIVNLVSTLVHVYSISYMEGRTRFMCYLCLFTFFMLMLITGDNLVQLFFGWEGVGLASYLLISFWFTRLQANKAAIKAMLMNRVGDVALALAIFYALWLYQSVDYEVIFSQSISSTVLCCLLFLGATGKSAQIGLHTWLPDAMEAPTPVSALLHAATMVTAGVFLLARCSWLFEQADTLALVIVTVVGAMTAFFAASTGIMQNDLKRVIAYSTCSQLGYMIFACGLSQYAVSVFHLVNHAFFKALLFLSAGAVIHALADEQDLRKMGAKANIMPFTYSMMLLGSLSLAGFPFLTGFYSKDVILELAYSHYSISGNFAFWLGSVCVIFTSYYSFRLLILAFFGSAREERRVCSGVHDAPLLMAIPLVLLALGSVFAGYLGKDMMIGLGSDFWQNALYHTSEHELLAPCEFYTPISIKMMPLLFTLGGAILAMQISVIQAYSSTYIHSLVSFLNQRWLFDKVYNATLVAPALSIGYTVCFRTLDQGILQLFGPLGISQAFQALAQWVLAQQSGLVYQYALVILLGCCCLLTPIDYQLCLIFSLAATVLC